MPPIVHGASTIAGRVRNLANMHRPVIDIALGTEPRGQPSYITSLSTLDSIDGRAYITAPIDTKFDQIEIAFKGTTKTFVDRMATVSAANSRQNAFHAFLTLRQPDVADHYPADNILKAGVTYEIPFEFVIPQHMPVNFCQHKVNNNKIRELHLQLPPSLGDPELAVAGNTLVSDMAPEMTRIAYGIDVRITHRRPSANQSSTVAERLRKLRVVPATEELPPVDIDGLDEEYCLRSEKAIKKSMLGSKLGRLAAEVHQPQSFRLPAPASTSDCPVTTTATVMLRFDPTDADVTPPRLGSMSAKLRVSTFFASAALRDFPSRAKMAYDANQGVTMDTLNLSSRCMENVQWERHDGTDDTVMRRGSNPNIGPSVDMPQPTKGYKEGKPFYTAQLLVPVSLPKNKSFVPTFYSCLVSRTYILELSLNLPARGGNAGFLSSVDLRVPVQITSEPSDEAIQRRASLANEVIQEVDEYFVPRSVAPPSPEYTPRAPQPTTRLNREAPPEYTYFAPRIGGTVPVCG